MGPCPFWLASELASWGSGTRLQITFGGARLRVYVRECMICPWRVSLSRRVGLGKHGKLVKLVVKLVGRHGKLVKLVSSRKKKR